MQKNKFGIILITLSIIAILVSILAQKNQNIIFNLAFAAFAAGIFITFAN